MTGTLLLGAASLPILLSALVWTRGVGRRAAIAIAPWAALPALLASAAPFPEQPVLLPWLLLGTFAGLDVAGRIFLFFTALLWTLAGLHARTYIAADVRHRYFFFHLLALGGNLGLIVSHDLASFYLFFALMTFSAYGLVVHDGSTEAFRAGRIYIVMAVAGETLLLLAFMVAASHAPSLALADIRAAAIDSPARNVLMPLFLTGFGIKAGAVPLHVWLPLAHPVAPTPASAVLSGGMIKAGVLGWVRFLPLGEGALTGWGFLVIAAGLVGAFFGVAIGLTQRNPKTVLAYSSISQMGIVNVTVGIGLSDPSAWQFAMTAIPVYAMHHGLAKGALFLGVSAADHDPRSAWGRRLIAAGLVVPALALAGAPITSGAIAKLALKDAAAVAPGAWAAWLEALLPFTAVGTTLLMGRFLVLALTRTPGVHAHSAGILVPWALATVASAFAVWFVPPLLGLNVLPSAVFAPYNLWLAAWPVLVGLLLIGLFVVTVRRSGRVLSVEIDAGDLLIPIEHLYDRRIGRGGDVPIAQISGAPDTVASLASSWYGLFAESRPSNRLARWEAFLQRWETAAGSVLLLLLLLVLLVGWAR